MTETSNASIEGQAALIVLRILLGKLQVFPGGIKVGNQIKTEVTNAAAIIERQLPDGTGAKIARELINIASAIP